MSFLKPAPPPATALGRYRLLSPNAGVHVSPIQLGAMSIGSEWSNLGMGHMDKDSSFKLLDAYFDKGGNFIDTASGYQEGTSEEFIGEWAEKRKIRDQLFIATKYTQDFLRADPTVYQRPLLMGNSIKNMRTSVETSLKRLRTDYIDLLYVHWWDWQTSVEEIMRGLHQLVLAGKVLYLGISDTPAWIVSKANQYAKDHALTPFSVYQGAWSILERSFEREIIPMAIAEGLALAPWGVLGGGKLRTDAEEEARLTSGEKGRSMFNPEWLRNDKEKKVSAALEKVAKEVGAKSITAVAIAYVLHKAPFVFPIIGGRKVEHLEQNIEGAEIALTDEQIATLDESSPFDPGFPGWFVGTGPNLPRPLASVMNAAQRPPVPIIKPTREAAAEATK